MLLCSVIGLAIVIIWGLCKRNVVVEILVTIVCISFVFSKFDPLGLFDGVPQFVNESKIRQLVNQLNHEAQTALSFCSNLMNKRGSLFKKKDTKLSRETGEADKNNQVNQDQKKEGEKVQTEGISNTLNKIVGKVKSLNLKNEDLIPMVSTRQIEGVELLIKNGANVNVQDQYGRTPLMIAASNYDTKMIKMLLANYADANIKDNSGSTVLIQAVVLGHMETFKLLIDTYYGRISQKNKDAALLRAVKLRRTEMVRSLIENHSNVNAKLPDGKTALMIASFRGYSEIVKMLLENGVDVNLKDKRGRTALFFAEKKKRLEVAKMLRDAATRLISNATPIPTANATPTSSPISAPTSALNAVLDASIPTAVSNAAPSPK